MVTRPNSPASKMREDLVKQVSMLPSFLGKYLKGKDWNDIGDIARGIEKEGGSNVDVLEETSKFTDPKTMTGVYREPGGSLVFNVPDEGMKLTPEAEKMLSQRMVGAPYSQSPVTELDKLMQHDLLYGFVPELRQQQAQVGKLSNRNLDDPPYGSYNDPGFLHPNGLLEAMGRGWVDPQSDEMWSTRNILSHEIQHALQSRFKLPQGSNPDNPNMHQFFDKEMRPYAQDLYEQMDREFQDWYDTQGKAQGMSVGAAKQLWDRLYPDKLKLSQDAENMVSMRSNNSRDRQAMYEKGVTGEIAANRAARDLGKSAEQLRSEYPFAVESDEMLAPLQMLRYGDSVTDWERPQRGLGGLAFRKGQP